MSSLTIDRRDFLKTGAAAGAGLVISFYLPAKGEAFATAEEAAKVDPNAWLQIAPDGRVTIWVAKSEMGQGILTSLPMVVAEELDADWKSVRMEKAALDPKFGEQGTGGSTSVRESWDTLRKAGAMARAMLVAAAAQKWGVGSASCATDSGFVVHKPSGRKERYGALATAAAKQPVPKDAKLKDPKDFRIIGKRVHRFDTPSKTDGSAQFGMDMRLPGMLYASLAQSPVYGGKVATFDAARAKQVKGVRDAVEVMGGVGVVADSFWQAVEGRRALEIKWDEGPNAKADMAQVRETLKHGMEQTAVVAHKDGDPAAVLAKAGKKLEVMYETPILAHATMEPMNCTADVRKDSCEVWSPTQWPSFIRDFGAKMLGLKPESIQVHITLLGGGFGRRAMPDFSLQAMLLSKAAGAPVKLVWTREDDMQHDFFRPPSLHRLSAALDGSGKPVAWTHRVVSASIDKANFPDEGGKPEEDDSLVDGASELPYNIPNLLVDYKLVRMPFPIGWWRSVFAAQNAFAQECFMDELAAAAGKDPYEFRLRLLDKAPRHKAVLQLAAEKAGWGKPLPSGRTRGIALQKSFDTHVAEVAEVSLQDDGSVRVHRVVCAVDCGIVVNPDTVEAQMQGAIVFGLTAALYGSITIENGRMQQGNFDTYPLLRMDEMPKVEVHIVPSAEHPGGIGEPGTPPIAPAVANAIFAATKKPIRSLPLRA